MNTSEGHSEQLLQGRTWGSRVLTWLVWEMVVVSTLMVPTATIDTLVASVMCTGSDCSERLTRSD